MVYLMTLVSLVLFAWVMFYVSKYQETLEQLTKAYDEISILTFRLKVILSKPIKDENEREESESTTTKI